MATIKDVAKKAGVSVATVSRVINSRGYVNIDTRKKVELAILELNFMPNEIARSLFKKETKTLGLIVPDIVNPFFPEMARAVEDTAHQLGYTVILCNTDESEEKAQRYLEIMRQKYVAGIILASSTVKLDNITALNIPVVSLDRKISTIIPTVVVNNCAGGRDATRFLKDKGCKRIGHIRGPLNVDNAEERCAGYLEEVSSEPWFEESYLEQGNYDMKSAFEATLKLMERHSDIEGIFAANDLMAIGAIKAIRKSGKRVPEDVAVIGFDGIALAEATSPELTTMAQPIYKMGTIITEMLVKLIQGEEVEQTFYELEVELIEREST